MAIHTLRVSSNRRRRPCQVFLLAVGVASVLVSCGSGTSTPTAAVPGPTPTPTPNASGIWDLTFTEVPVSGVLTLTENAGSVSGTLRIAGEAGEGTLTGSIAADGRMSLTGTEPGGARTVLQASLDTMRRSFTGTMQFPDEAMSLTVRGTKR